MRLDKYDIGLVKGTTGGDSSRPVLQCISLKEGKLAVADGFMAVVREADCDDGEKTLEVLLPNKMIEQVKADKNQHPILTVDGDRVTVTYETIGGLPLEHNPNLSFGLQTGDFPNYALLLKDCPTDKKARIAISVKMLKRLVAMLPDDGIVKLGIIGETTALEFDCGNMDRPIRGLIMPMFVRWDEFEWYREPEVAPPQGK